MRVSDELWDAAKVRAAERGENLSEKIREFLTEYTKGQHVVNSDNLAARTKAVFEAALEDSVILESEMPAGDSAGYRARRAETEAVRDAVLASLAFS